MMTPRIFVGARDPAPVPGTDYALPEAAARHLAHALRARVGDPVAIFTGTGGEYATTIARIDRRDVVLRIERHDPIERESPWPVTLVQAIIAADMMDFVVRKAVELGVAAIVPVQAARSQGMPDERGARRLTHWRQVAVAACEQCGRNRVPDVAAAVAFSDWVASGSETSDSIALLDAHAPTSLDEQSRAAQVRTVVIGPEGGFAPDEVRMALSRGAMPAHLGPRMLRAETAALAALATINAVAGDARRET
jgi:16S rRNA (uracil1498-N3)-methyltransferase